MLGVQILDWDRGPGRAPADAAGFVEVDPRAIEVGQDSVDIRGLHLPLALGVSRNR